MAVMFSLVCAVSAHARLRLADEKDIARVCTLKNHLMTSFFKSNKISRVPSVEGLDWIAQVSVEKEILYFKGSTEEEQLILVHAAIDDGAWYIAWYKIPLGGKISSARPRVMSAPEVVGWSGEIYKPDGLCDSLFEFLRNF